jgi:polysaccharide pyruvyl transferase WcaK-like protein
MTNPRVAYIGWHKRENVGDDALYEAVRSQLPGATFLDVPHLPREMFFAAAKGLSWSLRRSPLVVGGGTLIGRHHVRRIVNRGLALTRHNGSYAIGVGVEDPVFTATDSGDDELKRWIPILSEFRTVSVRGPLSAELLSDIGIDVEVSGEPALLLPQPDLLPEDGLIGVNLGFGEDLWGHDPAMLAQEMSGAIRQLSSQGYRFTGILMNPDDRPWTEAALDGISAEIVHPPDSGAAARELARCSVAIVCRLHAGILASLSGTPLVSLEYRPKCRDFALSIDDERSLIRTDAVSMAAVVDRVDGALADSVNIRSKTLAAVAHLRQRLSAEYADLRRQLGLAGQ